MLKENYCSQANINQSRSRAECPTVSLRKKLKEKGPSVFEGNSAVQQTRRQSLWHSLEAMSVAFQRSCERSGITEWPFHEITGNAGNSMFNQVWFVHKNEELELWKAQAQLHLHNKLTLDRVSFLFDR